jgi:ABC-type dipeptide/oligopeptide/nickel transport system permease subunit
MADTTHSQAGTGPGKATLDDPARLLGKNPGETAASLGPTTDSAAVGVVDTSTASGRFNRFDNPWLNPKLIGTDGAGRDLLALLIVGTPNTLMIGAVASLIGMSTGIFLGFTAGFVGGRTDDVIRVLSDVMITIPPLLILVVFQAAFGDISLTLMALLIAASCGNRPPA